MIRTMSRMIEKIPSPRELEKEIGDFLARRFGTSVKLVSPVAMPQEQPGPAPAGDGGLQRVLQFDLTPEALIAYLDQYIIQQDLAKAILATKICTHFNRLRREHETASQTSRMVGRIKNNVLMIGPTGVGKTYMIRLIARKIGVPFVKADATKFSETGYVGGDVEDLVRDLVREANDDIALAECGIVYIDEIDKIASSPNLMGADVSRTGVQRALLKPLEETEVDLKVPHDPVSMMQEIEAFRKTGSRQRRTVNTRNVLFIVSGAFSGLAEIVKARLHRQQIGFSAPVQSSVRDADLVSRVHSEDLIRYGFESEFVGRLPVRAVFDPLDEKDLFDILKNPNNPVLLSKRLDFAAYGIDVRFSNDALRFLAERAAAENTGARGLVSAVETALMPFERCLPSMGIACLAATAEALQTPEATLARLRDPSRMPDEVARHRDLQMAEVAAVEAHLSEHRHRYDQRYGLTLSNGRIGLVATCSTRDILDLGTAIERVRDLSDEVKQLELDFLKRHDINIVLEPEALDLLVAGLVDGSQTLADLQRRLTADFELALKLVRDKTGRHRFFISRSALEAPQAYLEGLVRDAMKSSSDGPAPDSPPLH